jgi:hypothetical protein
LCFALVVGCSFNKMKIRKTLCLLLQVCETGKRLGVSNASTSLKILLQCGVAHNVVLLIVLFPFSWSRVLLQEIKKETIQFAVFHNLLFVRNLV